MDNTMTATRLRHASWHVPWYGYVGAILLTGAVLYLIFGSHLLGGNVGRQQHVNLLQSGWSYMPGVTVTDSGLQVAYLGRSLVRQDGSPGQENPPVNIYGTHLMGGGDWTIRATLQDIQGSATLRLYSDVPDIQDEFREEPSSLSVTFHDGGVTVQRWQAYSGGSVYGQAPVESHDTSLSSVHSPTITIQRTNGHLVVAANGTHVYTTSAPGLLDRAVWFGLTADHPTDHWKLTQLEADLSPGVTRRDAADASVVNKLSDGLQTLAQQKRPAFTVGAAAALGPLATDEMYTTLALGGNFGQLTTENVLKWQFIHPQPDLYDFREADAFVAIAAKNHLSVHGHTLIFGEANPAWVRQLPTATPDEKTHVRDVMIDHIVHTVGHFKGHIASWDVVNEPLAEEVEATSDGLRQHIWYQALGSEYIAEAFRAAHQADPQAKLFINEYGLEADGERWNMFLQLVTGLKSQGVPLDGVGFQAHVYEAADDIDPAILRSHIRQLAAIGLVSRISEMDVRSDAGTQKQADQYAGVFAACLADPSCVSWSTWGITDRHDLYLDDQSAIQVGSDFLWNAQGDPTPAVAAIRKAIR